MQGKYDNNPIYNLYCNLYREINNEYNNGYYKPIDN
jgi:hypothetical protein